MFTRTRSRAGSHIDGPLSLYTEDDGFDDVQIFRGRSESDAGVRKCVVVGAGLCGTLASIMLADAGFHVDVFERRPEAELFADGKRSFNLTLTERGLRVLRAVGLEDRVLAAGVRCKGRRVHLRPGEEGAFTPYGIDSREGADEPDAGGHDRSSGTAGAEAGGRGRPEKGSNDPGSHFLLSISRNALNKLLLQEMLARAPPSEIGNAAGRSLAESAVLVGKGEDGRGVALNDAGCRPPSCRGTIRCFFGRDLSALDLNTGAMRFVPAPAG